MEDYFTNIYEKINGVIIIFIIEVVVEVEVQ